MDIRSGTLPYRNKASLRRGAKQTAHALSIAARPNVLITTSDERSNAVYIRWVVRKHKNASVADVIFHNAYLVESYRDERDTPRQRTISYLGNIRQMGDVFPALEREVFLLRAERILAGVPELSGEDRVQVMGLLRQRVPPLTDNEVAEAFRNNLRWYYQWWRERGNAPSSEELLRIIESAGEGIGPM